MASDDDEDYAFYGTPIEEEQETKRGQHRKEVKDAASTRALPVWQQEATDEQGRRRFHGAFTGGFSAGYFNTVGSAEGWAPSSFRSSRSARWAGEKAQSVEQYLDEDELEELRRTNLQTTEQYDTFGSTAAELARRAAVDAERSRPSAIPGLLPEELVAPVADSVGVRLLQRMGWRQGKGVGTGTGAVAADEEEEEEDSGGGEGGGGRRRRRGWGQHAGVGSENTPLYLLAPKTDTFGLGFDPFKGAEEFRKAKQERLGTGPGRQGGQGQQQQQAGVKRRRGVAFGTGVLDEDDAFGIMEDYVTHDDIHSYEDTVDDAGMPMARGPKVARGGLGDRLQRRGYTFEVQDEEEEEEEGGMGRGGRHQHQYRLPSTVEPHLALQSKEHLVKAGGFIPGFVRASAPPATPPFFPPPKIPQGWRPLRHPAALQQPQQGQQGPLQGLGPPPPEAQPPSDPALKQEIDSLAFYVAKNGVVFETMARQRAQREGGGRHGFLLGGEGGAYYQWKVHYFKKMIQPQLMQPAIGQRPTPLSFEERGALLGERPLPAQQPQQTQQAQQAQQQQGAGQTLARNLLAVAEADRQRIQAMLGRSFVSASASEILQPEAVVGGLRKPAPAPAAPPAPLPVTEDRGPGPAGAAGAAGTAAAAAATAAALGALPPGRIITAADLSRPVGEAGGAAVGAGAGAAAAQQQRLPVRTSEEWRPAPLLCKRLNVPDPYHGRPAEMQMSRFKTDHLALPETAAAALARPVPPGAEELLMPPEVQQAILAAQQIAQQAQQAAQQAQQAAQQAQQQAQQGEEPADAAGLADQFLSSLAADLMGGGEGSSAAEPPPPLPPGQPPPLPGAAAAAAAGAGGGEGGLAGEAAAAVAERPIDLFKAIFEDSEEEGEEQEATDATKQPQGQEQSLKPAQEPLSQQAQQGTGASAGVLVVDDDTGDARAQPRQAQHAQQARQAQQQGRPPADNLFGFAKLRGEAPAAGGARGGGEARPATGGPAVAAPAAAGSAGAAAAVGAGIDEETKRRVEEALRALRRHEKGRKEKKEKKRGKEKRSRRHEKRERKEKKAKKASSKKGSGGKRRRSRERGGSSGGRRSAGSSDSGASCSSGESDSE